ncbi:MAG: beta-CASP ribonuclease aCPSF1 [archaeon]
MAFLEELQKELPKDAEVSDARLEGSNIVIYTPIPEYFAEHSEIIKKLVDKYKKRVDLRADESILVDQDLAKKVINELVPKEAEITEITFLKNTSRVIVEAKKPGLVIGKNGTTLHEIKKHIKWSPRVERTPVIPSKIITTIRHVLYTNLDDRGKFLESLGKKVKPSAMLDSAEGDDSRWIRISALGGSREVGRSCNLVQTPDSKVLLDCGVNVAIDGPNAYPYLNAPEFDLKSLDAVVISHAHLDHSGFLPYLYKYEYDGPVYCTAPTRDLMTLLQLDYVDIAQREGKKVPYTNKEIQEVIKHSISLEYGEVTDIASDIRLTLYNAGHILGSSQVHLHIGEGLHNIIYTGDIKCEPTNLFEGATSKFMRLETLIMESTYGGKNDIQPSARDGEAKLISIIEKAIGTKSKVLIPVLAVGRAQEVMIVLEKWARRTKREDIHVYLDGMIWDATAIHTAYPECLSKGLRQLIFHEDQNPFMSPIFKRIGSQKERKALIESAEPAVILATSGMLAGGPSVEYLRHLADNPKNHLVFVSYQAEGSMGKRIQKGWDKVTIENQKGKQEITEVKMQVDTIEGFSGHSDRNSLMRFVGNLNPKPDRVLVVHGDHTKCLDLASSLHKMYSLDTYAMKNLEAIRLR